MESGGSVSRRRVLIGGALGALGVVGLSAAPAWSWSATGSVAADGSGADPRYIWDADVDQIVASLIDDGQVPLVNRILADWTTNNQALPSGLPADLADLLTEARRLPAWADQNRLAAGARFTQKYGSYLGLLYGLCSGLLSCAIPHEARAVYYSAGAANMKLRVAKTAKLGYEVMQTDAYQPTGQMIVTACKTRMVHAGVRHLLPQSAGWEGAPTEVKPISQDDILVTWHSLATTAMHHLTAWNVPMDPVEVDGFLHVWQVTAHMLGVLDEYIPATWSAASMQYDQVLAPVIGPTPEGVELARVLLQIVAQADAGLTQPFVEAMIRYMLGRQVADWLEIPDNPYWDRFVSDGWPKYVAAHDALLPVPLVPEGYGLFDQFVEQGVLFYVSDGQPINITIPTTNRVGPVRAD
ncbi:MAG TPA: oxygenase MpaB family protein [Acidimicrobiales bacterium]|jgi:hypothetical protein|nr:oxygenase MpaB family protein [Acidimicrobiales bacterium]